MHRIKLLHFPSLLNWEMSTAMGVRVGIGSGLMSGPERKGLRTGELEESVFLKSKLGFIVLTDIYIRTFLNSAWEVSEAEFTSWSI